MNILARKLKTQPTQYPDINEILHELLRGAQLVLGENFVGMALDGSLATGDFDYETSDIDFVVATAVVPTAQQFEGLAQLHGRLGSLHTKWAIELEGAYIPLPALRRYDANNATHPYIDRGGSNLRWEHLDVDWIIHYHVLHTAGITMAGPAIQTLVDPVPPGQLKKAVADLLDVWWVPMLKDAAKLEHDGYRTYAIMTMGRMLYTAQTGKVTSKQVAARWVIETQAKRWRPLVAAALQWRGHVLAASLAETQAFIEFTREAIA